MRPMPPGIHRVKATIGLALLLFAIGTSSIHCGSEALRLDPTPTLTDLPRPTETLTSTSTPTETRTPTPSLTWTPTSSPTPFPTDTTTPTLTDTPTVPPTSTATNSIAVQLDAPSAARVPILMFHHVIVPPPGTDAVGIDLSVPPDVFDAEIKFLFDRGFHSIHLTDLINHLKNGAPLPSKPIIITFDDGYDDNYLNAFPTLKDFGFVGSFFIISNRPDGSVSGYMTWKQIEEMAANGMEIGSHSWDHRFNLGEMSSSVQWAEIRPSYDAILQHLPNQAPVFAYPSGSYNATTMSFLSRLGYVAAVTTMQSVTQYANAPLELRRLRIRGEWSIGEFVYWLNYWLGAL